MRGLFKIFAFIFLLGTTTSTLLAQGDCPPGYLQREVRCGGTIIKKCLPAGYSCKSCWTVWWPKCDTNERGGDNYADSYDAADALAQARKLEMSSSSCRSVNTDYNRWRIFLADDKSCSFNFTALNDLKSKILPFLQRYRAEVANYRRYIEGKPYSPGANFKEYKTLVDDAPRKQADLENMSNNATDQSIAKLETFYKELQSDSEQLKKLDLNLRAEDSQEEKIKEAQKVQEQNRQELQQFSENLNRQMAATNDRNAAAATEIGQSVGDFVSSLSKVMASNRARKQKMIDRRTAPYIRDADKGDKAAMKTLVGMYEYTYKDHDEADYWRMRLIEAGDNETLETVIRAYQYGTFNYKKDWRKAEEFLNYGAAKGSKDNYRILANRFEDGRGVFPKDKKKAKLYRELYEGKVPESKPVAEQKESANEPIRDNDLIANLTDSPYFQKINSSGTTLSSGVRYTVTQRGLDEKLAPGESFYLNYSKYSVTGILVSTTNKQLSIDKGIYSTQRENMGGYKPIKYLVGETIGISPLLGEVINAIHVGDIALVFVPENGSLSSGEGVVYEISFTK